MELCQKVQANNKGVRPDTFISNVRMSGLTPLSSEWLLWKSLQAFLLDRFDMKKVDILNFI